MARELREIFYDAPFGVGIGIRTRLEDEGVVDPSAAFEELDTIEDVAADEDAMIDIAASEQASGDITISEVAMDAVSASETAMDAVAASQTAMDAVVVSETAMDAVAASQTAMDAVAASEAAMDSVSASETAMDAVVASETAMDAVVASETAMDAVAASQTAMDVVIQSDPAFDSVVASEVADPIYHGSQLYGDALATVGADDAAGVGDSGDVAASETAMNSVAASEAAMDAVSASETAMDAVAVSEVATEAVVEAALSQYLSTQFPESIWQQDAIYSVGENEFIVDEDGPEFGFTIDLTDIDTLSFDAFNDDTNNELGVRIDGDQVLDTNSSSRDSYDSFDVDVSTEGSDTEVLFTHDGTTDRGGAVEFGNEHGGKLCVRNNKDGVDRQTHYTNLQLT